MNAICCQAINTYEAFYMTLLCCMQGKTLQAVERALTYGCNQIVYIGNPYVRHEKGLYDMVQKLDKEVTRPEKLCTLVVHGMGRSIKAPGSNKWVSQLMSLTLQ